MSEENTVDKNVEIVATVNLTEEKVKQALVNLVSEEKRLVELLEGKNCHLWVKWNVFKWDNPDTFCTLTFGAEKEPTQEVPNTPHED